MEQGYNRFEANDSADCFLSVLEDDEREMISKYYGLFDGRKRSLRELEREYDYSYEWIRQKINRAIEKMKGAIINER